MWDKWGWVLLAAAAVFVLLAEPPVALGPLLAGGAVEILVGVGKWLVVLVCVFYGVSFLRGDYSEDASRPGQRERS